MNSEGATVDIILSFQGNDADNGHVEAYSGIESASGISRSLILIANYAVTGTIRHRFPFDDQIKFYLESTEPGSFNWKMTLNFLGGLSIGIATNAVYDLTKLVLSKAIGEEPSIISPEVQAINDKRSGDIDALVEAVEPALKKGHYGIGGTVERIVIKEQKTMTTIVSFDSYSKSYLLDSIDAEESAQDVSISALNVNDRTGRAYFLDLKRTVPFRVPRDANPRTMSVLSAALDSYANKNPAPVQILFRKIEAVDGRLKRIVISDAINASDEE